MSRYALTGLGLGCMLILGCPPAPPIITPGGPSAIVNPSTLSVPSGGVGEFTVALSADPGGQVTVDIFCIAGGCGFTPNPANLVFDSSNFSVPQTVLLADIGFQGRGESVFEVSGDAVTAADVTVVRD